MNLEHGASCPICEQGVLEKGTTRETLRFRGLTKEVTGLTHYICNVCKDGFYSKPSELALDQAFISLQESYFAEKERVQNEQHG